MSNEIVETKEIEISNIEKVLMSGDLAGLSPDERVQYHNKVCESLGLNYLTKPFEYIKLNGKLQLYAKKDATDQLRKLQNISVKIVSRENFQDLCIVTAQATDKTGRTDESTGMVSIQGLKGQDLANAYMKAETKAKRRVTLSICGLGILDESEAEDISNTAKDVTPDKQTHFLPKKQVNHDGLIQAFMGLGISKGDLLDLCMVEDVNDLTDDMVDDLRAIYKDIRAGNKSKDDFFGKNDIPL